jgi:hypothetical protein
VAALLVIFYAFLLAPVAGLWVLASGEFAYSNADPGILTAYLIHVACVIVGLMLVGHRKRVSLPIDSPVSLALVKYRVIFVLLVADALIFAVGGARILSGDADRGDVRISLGYFGFAYTWVLVYLLPATFAFASYAYTRGRDRARSHMAYLLVVALTALGGFLSGYKFTAVSVLLPGAAIALRRASLLKLLVAATVGVGLVMAGAILLDGRSPDEALAYTVFRASAGAAFGPVAAWNEFPDGGAPGDIFAGLLLGLGSKAMSFITGYPEDSIEFLKYNLARWLTYQTYPDADRAVSGAVNITVTAFGEAVFFFGRKWFFIYSLMCGAICGFALRWVRTALESGGCMQAVLSTVYFTFVILPWMNSGGIVQLVSLPVIVGYGMLFLLLQVLMDVRGRKTSGPVATVSSA